MILFMQTKLGLDKYMSRFSPFSKLTF